MIFRFAIALVRKVINIQPISTQPQRNVNVTPSSQRRIQDGCSLSWVSLPRLLYLPHTSITHFCPLPNNDPTDKPPQLILSIWDFAAWSLSSHLHPFYLTGARSLIAFLPYRTESTTTFRTTASPVGTPLVPRMARTIPSGTQLPKTWKKEHDRFICQCDALGDIDTRTIIKGLKKKFAEDLGNVSEDSSYSLIPRTVVHYRATLMVHMGSRLPSALKLSNVVSLRLTKWTMTTSSRACSKRCARRNPKALCFLLWTLKSTRVTRTESFM